MADAQAQLDAVAATVASWSPDWHVFVLAVLISIVCGLAALALPSCLDGGRACLACETGGSTGRA